MRPNIEEQGTHRNHDVSLDATVATMESYAHIPLR